MSTSIAQNDGCADWWWWNCLESLQKYEASFVFQYAAIYVNVIKYSDIDTSHPDEMITRREKAQPKRAQQQ